MNEIETRLARLEVEVEIFIEQFKVESQARRAHENTSRANLGVLLLLVIEHFIAPYLA